MVKIDIQSMMIHLPTNNGVGENQEYNSLYLEIEPLANGTPESVMGDSIVQGKDPDWSKLFKVCSTLWEKTRDLRVAVYFSIALSQLNGLGGFRDGLKVLDWLIAEHWENLYPNLDSDDDNDPTERINILQTLSPLTGMGLGSGLFFIALFRNIKLFSNKQYTLRDLLISQGEISTDSDFNTAFFNAEMSAVSQDSIKEQFELVNDIINILDIIEENIAKYVGMNYPFSFQTLKTELSVLMKFYSKLMNVQTESMLEVEMSEETNEQPQQIQQTTVTVANFDSYKPRTRSEALILIRKSADYFREAEPTNPVPYFLERVLRIAEMNFIDLLQDIEPNSLEKIKEQLGILRQDNG